MLDNPWNDFEEVIAKRIKDTNEYYDQLAPAKKLSKSQHKLLRGAVSGLLWT